MYLEIRITCQEGKLIRKLSDHSDKIKVHQSLLYFDNLSLKKNYLLKKDTSIMEKKNNINTIAFGHREDKQT